MTCPIVARLVLSECALVQGGTLGPGELMVAMTFDDIVKSIGKLTIFGKHGTETLAFQITDRKEFP